MNKSYLEITVQPIDQFHFRYEKEMNERHGTLTGHRKGTYPTVCVRNFNGEALILCTLYQMPKSNEIPFPHSHLLIGRHDAEYKTKLHTAAVSQVNGYQAKFDGMIIMNTKREFIEDKLFEKLAVKTEFECGEKLTPAQNDALRAEAKKRAKSGVDLNRALLCFEAYISIDGRWKPLCRPVFSTTINEKSKVFIFTSFFFERVIIASFTVFFLYCISGCAKYGPLEICRISSAAGSAMGNEDLFMFVKKVDGRKR